MKRAIILLVGIAVLAFIFIAIRSAEKDAVADRDRVIDDVTVAPVVEETPPPEPVIDMTPPPVAETVEPAPMIEEPPPPEMPAVRRDLLTLAGTDCAVELVTAWAEAFTNATSNIAFSVRGNLPEDVAVDLIHGRADLGLMDRKMTNKERLAVEDEYGIQATAYRVADSSEQHPSGIWVYAIKEDRYRLQNKQADAFLQFILSGEGQKIAADFGHATLSEELAKDALDALDVTYVAPPEEDAEAAVETDE